MKILHTSDWHAGKGLRGRSRAEEHRAVLAEIAALARVEEVDVVLVAGDLFDTAAPAPEAEQLVWQALLDLAGAGAAVIALAGNHDHPARFDAARGLAGHAGITLMGQARRPDDGGVVEVRCRSGERVQVAVLPFCSQRHVVRAAHLMGCDPSTTYQAVNCGGVSYASYRLAPLVKEVLAYQPDLVIVMTGENEFLEDRTYQSVKTRSAKRMKTKCCARKRIEFQINQGA